MRRDLADASTGGFIGEARVERVDAQAMITIAVCNQAAVEGASHLRGKHIGGQEPHEVRVQGRGVEECLTNDQRRAVEAE